MLRVFSNISFYRDSITNSYSQVLFSGRPWLGVCLLVASFINPYAGASGLAAVAFTLLLVNLLGLNKELMRNGSYGYNMLLLSLAMDIYFNLSVTFFLLLALGCFITLMLTVWMAVRTAPYRIPFLSLPFLVAVWMILLSSRNIGSMQLTDQGIYELNELWKMGGATLVSAYDQAALINLPLAIDVYLRSLAAIFFQHNLIAGVLIAIGLLMHSRIAFSLSLIAFYAGYFFCWATQGNIEQLHNSYVGFNFVLTGLAVGIYFIPSIQSYLLAALLMPVVSILMGALDVVISSYQLPIFSLPFSLVVIALVFLMWNRADATALPMVVNQLLNPEKNLYAYRTDGIRFANSAFWHIQLPFYGEWRVSQGHGGGITHKGDWAYAWDFDIADETGKTFKLPGHQLSDFYCYGLPVLAPAAGYVVNIINEVEDNEVGSVNTAENWGNTIVIKHHESLYSKHSHIKKDSFKVKIGDYVRQGTMLAACGNSGRSPEPHIHFQLQSTPDVGSKPLKYPIAFFIEKGEQNVFRSFSIPEEGTIVFNPEPNPTVQHAFEFIPGQKIKFVTDGAKPMQEEWEMMVDAYNQSYIYCNATQSAAYFVNNGINFYFTQFFGNKQSLLYKFYLAAYKLVLTNYPGIQVADVLSVEGFHQGIAKFLHDFTAPFYLYLSGHYQSRIVEKGDAEFEISSEAILKRGSRTNQRIAFTISVDATGILQFTVFESNACITAKRF